MKRNPEVIINGDDFGYGPASSDGIVKAYQYGILTSTSAMVNLLEGSEKITNFQPEIDKPRIGIGVHLNLTFGKPLAPEVWGMEAFTRPHRGTGKPEEWQGSAWRQYFSRFSGDQILAEFRAQIKRAQELFGEIDHLDSHQGAASYPPAKEVYEKLAKEFNLGVRFLSPLSENSVYGGDFLFDEDYPEVVRHRGIRTADHVDMTYYHSKSDPVGEFCRALESIQDGELVEFMFHPASDPSLGDWRVKDLGILTNDRVIQTVKDAGIKLTTYRDSSR